MSSVSTLAPSLSPRSLALRNAISGGSGVAAPFTGVQQLSAVAQIALLARGPLCSSLHSPEVFSGPIDQPRPDSHGDLPRPDCTRRISARGAGRYSTGRNAAIQPD